MCLILRDKQPRIAKKDIIVCKYVLRVDNYFFTPIYMANIPINKVMKAKPNKPCIECHGKDLAGNDIYNLGGGAIHAELFDKKFSCGLRTPKKAIIPAGTEYWLSAFGEDVAAKSMIVTDEDWDGNLSENLMEEILADAPEIGGVRVGDYLLDNGSYTRPRKGLSKDDVVGIVSGFHEGKPLVAALDYFVKKKVKYTPRNIKHGKFYDCVRDVIELFDGRFETQKYKNGERTDRFNAFKDCVDYRKDKNEDWYLGAAGEVKTMLSNGIYLNAAHEITCIGFAINYNEWYHSCTERSCWSCWCCRFGVTDISIGRCDKNEKFHIVPFLSM